MEDIPRSTTPVASQAIDPGLLQQVLVALAQLQVQSNQRPPPLPRDPKVPDVQTFNGNKNQYAVFLARLQNFFSLQPTTYNSDAKKIGYVISRLEGSAADWAVTLLENPTEGINHGILNNWETFSLAFSKFSDPFSKRNATDALLSLTQGKSQSVLTYWTKFSELLYRSDISPDSARPLFERGLKYEIRDRLVDKELPDDLDSYVMAVVDLDNRLFRLRQDRRNSNGSGSHRDNYQQSHNVHFKSHNGLKPMEIGNVVAQEEVLINGVMLSNSKERLEEIRNMEPDMRRQVCVQEKRCHYCKRVVGSPPEHVAANCPLKNKVYGRYSRPPEVGPQFVSIVDSSPSVSELCLNFVSELQGSLLLKYGNFSVNDCNTPVEIMFDSGAMGMGYIDRAFVEHQGFKCKKLDKAITVKSIDGSACGSGAIEFLVEGKISFETHCEEISLMVIKSPRHPIILGYQWFLKNNPSIDWKSGGINFVKNEKGVPVCTTEGIPQRQVSVISQKEISPPSNERPLSVPHKRVSFNEKASIRIVKNYIKSLRAGSETGRLNLPAKSSEYESAETESVQDAPSVYVSVNALLEYAETDEGLLIGFVDQFSVVAEDDNQLVDPINICEIYKDVFSTSDFPTLPPSRSDSDLAIELEEGKSPPFGPIYSLSIQEEEVLKNYLDGALAAGIIQPSKSPAGAPVMFVKKSDGSLRLCVDYRGLNSITKTNRAALPIIRDMLFRAKGAKYYSKVDLKSAFNLIRILKGHEYLTAFRTKYGHFEYLVMPFGLKNAPGQFQALMNSIFGDLIDRGVLVYIDDLLLYSSTKETHDRLLVEVFERLRKNDLKANPKKCSFYQPRVEFLGHVISEKGVEMDARKLESIQQWKVPITVKELQSFLGLCNYYRDFIPKFAELAGPLYKLTKKDCIYVWKPECQQAFDSIKSSFSIDHVLIQPDTAKQFYLECDASDYAIGAVLSQMDEEGRLRPIGFFSRKFSAAEINYEIHDKELLAIIEGLKNWRHYCIGTEMPVQVFTDHNNLRYFMSSRNLNRRQARWSLFLADYNFEIIIRPGSQQVVSDALSRQESMQVDPGDEEYKINQQVLLPRNKFNDVVYLQEGASNDSQEEEAPQRQDVIHLSVLVSDDDQESSSSMNSEYDVLAYRSDEGNLSEFDEDDVSAVGDVAQFMELEGMSESEDPLWFQYLLRFLWSGELPMVLPLKMLNQIKRLSQPYIFKNDRLYRKLVRNQQMYHVPYVPYVDREAIIIKYHMILGHMQVNTLLPLLETRYYWPSLEKDIKKFQNACPQCQMNDNSQQRCLRPLQPHEPVGIPFMKWGIDYVQDLPSVDGYCNIFSARCYATKRVIYIPTKDRSAKTAAECIFQGIVCKYGSPVEIVSDRGFMDSVLAEYLKLLEIHHLPSAAYTPRTNGLDERGHQDLKNIITKLSDGDPKKWTLILPLAEFIMNSRISNSTGFSAFYLSHGFEPRLPCDELPALPPGYYDLTDPGDIAFLSSNELARLGQNRAAALKRLQAQAIRMKMYYDKKVGATTSRWEPGDVVKMINHGHTRFKHRFIGPFYIADRGPNDTYFLQRPDGRRWTSQNGTDTPVNPEDLAPYSEFDGEYYYPGH